MPGAVPASQEDWGTEYLDYILSIKTVYSVEENHCAYQSLQHRSFRSYYYKQLYACTEIPG